MPITIKDIARIAGVSHSTVSRCLNNKGGYSDDTFQKIKKIAAELGFEFNANARSLSTAKTGTIGIIYDEYRDSSNLHPFSVRFQKYIRRILEREDLDTIVTFSHNASNGIDNIERLVSKRKVDGIIIVKSNISSSTYNFLRRMKIPFVFAHQMPDKSLDDIDCVYCDHYLGGYLAGSHLLDKGCTRLLCVTRKEKRKEFSLRTEGFISAVSDRNVQITPEDLINGGDSFYTGYDAVKRNISRVRNYNGIFAHTDFMALGILKALEEENITVPGDMAVIGYDGIEFCDFTTPSLSTVEQPAEKVSILTCERLIDLLSGTKKIKSRKIVIPPTVIERDSSKYNR